MSTLKAILDEALSLQERLINDAFEAGRTLGREEASKEIWFKIGTLMPSPPLGLRMSSDEPEEAPVMSDGGGQNGPDLGPEADEGGRASPGSVKPEITRLVFERPGTNTRELQRLTGFKLNSIRGTLWTLQQEKIIERRDNGIYPVAQNNEAEAGADHGDAEAQTNEAVGNASEEEAPTASVENVQSDVFN